MNGWKGRLRVVWDGICDWVSVVLFGFLVSILRRGPIPRHVAFIMDGNRRWARRNRTSAKAGHESGYDVLESIVEACRDVGIEEVTCYAFSIENFCRPRHEVDDLMDLACSRLERLAFRERDGLSSRISTFPVIKGHLSYLPERLRNLILSLSPKEGTQELRFNVCVSYTSTDELDRTLQYVQEAIRKKMIAPSDISFSLLEEAMIDPPDLLVRTSGEIRLSDFLLWQAPFSLLSFTRPFWPEFSRLRLLWEVLKYQHFFSSLSSTKERLRAIELGLESGLGTSADVSQGLEGSEYVSRVRAAEEKRRLAFAQFCFDREQHGLLECDHLSSISR